MKKIIVFWSKYVLNRSPRARYISKQTAMVVESEVIEYYLYFNERDVQATQLNAIQRYDTTYNIMWREKTLYYYHMPRSCGSSEIGRKLVKEKIVSDTRVSLSQQTRRRTY